MIAALPMYDLPHARAAHDSYWQAIAAHLPGAPTALTRDGDLLSIWQSDELLLAQTCGLPYRARLHGAVTLVGTPDYGLTGCPPGHYRSVLVTRPGWEGDAGAATLAFNEPLSQSGWAAAQNAGLGKGKVLQTGAHAASARAVAEGGADIAAIDALTWSMLQTEEPGLTGALTVRNQTPPTPGLPYITAKHRDPAPIAAAIRDAIGTLTPEDCATLHLKGLMDIPKADYMALPLPVPPSLG
ncbi:MAG: PhnD/SsuA/transferrin family substrate-binding protein [Pseudomonadota bacterium]